MMTDYLTRGQILKKSYGGKEYEIERYQGEHENEYGVFEVKNGVRDGTAELFDDGIVKMRWTMKNGVREGSYVLFDKGVVTGEGKWEDIGKSEDRVVENRRSGLIMVIHFNNAIIYEGGFNESMQRNGFGLEYENGVLKRGGEWKDDELVYLSQRFLNDSEMIEYSSGSTYDLFSHRPVYIGGYCKDELSGQIVRDGRGRVLDEWSGVCEYESEWDGGKELTDRRVTLREGWYCGHEHQQSTRRVVTGDEPGESMSEDLNESSPFLLTPGSGSSLLNEPVRPNEAVNPNELSTPNESNNLNESLSRVNSTKSTDSTKSNNSSNPIENAKHKLRNLRQFFTIPPRVQYPPHPHCSPLDRFSRPRLWREMEVHHFAPERYRLDHHQRVLGRDGPHSRGYALLSNLGDLSGFRPLFRPFDGGENGWGFHSVHQWHGGESIRTSPRESDEHDEIDRFIERSDDASPVDAAMAVYQFVEDRGGG